MASLSTIQPGDIVRVNVGGRVFHAIVSKKRPRQLEFEPIERGITFRNCKSTQVERHWRQTKNVPKVRTKRCFNCHAELHGQGEHYQWPNGGVPPTDLPPTITLCESCIEIYPELYGGYRRVQ